MGCNRPMLKSKPYLGEKRVLNSRDHHRFYVRNRSRHRRVSGRAWRQGGSFLAQAGRLWSGPFVTETGWLSSTVVGKWDCQQLMRFSEMASPYDKFPITLLATPGSMQVWAVLTQNAIVVPWTGTVDRVSGQSDTDELSRESLLMARAIELIVERCVQSEDREALEDLRMRRRRLVRDLEPVNELDYTPTIQQIEREIAAIEAGLTRLGRRTNRG